MSPYQKPMAQPTIILYDLAQQTQPSQAWAPNVWRIRLVLNFKKLPYRTRWIDLTQVESIIRESRGQPTLIRPDGRPIYNLPIIYDESTRTVLSGVERIVDYLEVTYPARPVFPEGSRAVQGEFARRVLEVFMPLLPIIVPMSHRQLPERSRGYYPGPQNYYQPNAAEIEATWSSVKAQFDIFASILDRNAAYGDGVVAMGGDVTYADLVLCSVLIWIKTVSPNDGWRRIRQWNGGRWVRLRDRCKALGYTDFR